MRGRPMVWLGLLLGLLLAAASARAAEFNVGPGQKFARIEEANRAASPGDAILVHPAPDDYPKTAVQVTKARLTFRAVPAQGATHVRLDGTGYNYTGAGSVPRAIFQVNAGADGVVIEGFELANASNDSSNGAGVRVNQANQVTLRGCAIHANDMGIMSNGDGTLARCRDLVIERCRIYDNGNAARAGYNHNLYLGGASVTVQACEIYGARTGHNLKSRAHFNLVRYCYIHDSANRELDLVDERETALPNSNSVLIGNVIVKQPRRMDGNKAVIHFGRDGKEEHDGTLYLVNNTIVTWYLSDVVQLSAPKAQVELVNNVVACVAPEVRAPGLVGRSGGVLGAAAGRGNWLSRGYSFNGTSLRPAENFLAQEAPAAAALFADPEHGDWRPTKSFAAALLGRGVAAPTYRDGDGREQSALPERQPVLPLGDEARPAADQPMPGAWELPEGATASSAAPAEKPPPTEPAAPPTKRPPKPKRGRR